MASHFHNSQLAPDNPPTRATSTAAAAAQMRTLSALTFDDESHDGHVNTDADDKQEDAEDADDNDNDIDAQERDKGQEEEEEEEDGGGGFDALIARTQSTRGASSTHTLRSTAAQACKRVYLGTAIMPTPLWNEPDYASIVSQEFNAVVIEHHLKWTPLCVAEPGPLPDESPCEDRLGRYDFHHVDRMVDWALQHNLRVKGHVLIWHVTSPTALLQPMDAPALKQAMQRHIFTVMGHYRGRITDWDVVNEALAPDGSLAENIFWQTLGPSYIADCFRWAHQADPTARLFYNDNKVEGIGTPKADAFYNLIADLQAEDVPIHGVGLQAHFKAGGIGPQAVPTPRAVKQQIHRLGQLGMVVHLSEMDVRVGTLDESKRGPAQCQIYHDILAAALSEPATEAIYLWGFTDKHTWIRDFYQDVEDADEESPLLWDTHYTRKPAYFAVRQALQTLTPGGRVGGDGVLLDSDVDVEGHVWGHTWRPVPDSITRGGGGGGSSTTHVVDAGAGRAGDDRPDWLQDTSTPLLPPLTNKSSSLVSTAVTQVATTPDALFKLHEDEVEHEIVQQNHRTMSSMDILHHHLDMVDGESSAAEGLASADDDDDDDDDDDEQDEDGRSRDTEDLFSNDDPSGDDLTAPLENLRDNIPELS